MSTIHGIKGSQFEVVKVDDNNTRPNLKADLVKRGFDGNTYHMRRVLTGRQTKAYTTLCYRGAESGTFQTII